MILFTDGMEAWVERYEPAGSTRYIDPQHYQPTYLYVSSLANNSPRYEFIIISFLHHFQTQILGLQVDEYCTLKHACTHVLPWADIG